MRGAQARIPAARSTAKAGRCQPVGLDATGRTFDTMKVSAGNTI
jgi:hypothetical protein